LQKNYLFSHPTSSYPPSPYPCRAHPPALHSPNTPPWQGHPRGLVFSTTALCAAAAPAARSCHWNCRLLSHTSPASRHQLAMPISTACRALASEPLVAAVVRRQQAVASGQRKYPIARRPYQLCRGTSSLATCDNTVTTTSARLGACSLRGWGRRTGRSGSR
jgi:hypothetical protein